MRIDQLKLFQPKSKLLFPVNGFNNKYYNIVFLGENTTFLECFNRFNIPINYIKKVFIPTTKLPRTRLTANLRRVYVEHKLRPIPFNFGEYEDISSSNSYIDLSMYLDATVQKYNFAKYNIGRPLIFMKNLMDSFSGLPTDSSHKILMYAIDLDKALSGSFFARKIFPIYQMLYKKENIPFDYIVVFFYNKESSGFMKVYDSSFPNPTQLSRFKSYLMKLNSGSVDEIDDANEDQIVNIVKTELKYADNDHKEEVQAAVERYLKIDKSVSTEDTSPDNINNIKKTAIAYHITGDLDKAKKLSKSIPEKSEKNFINMFSKQVLSAPKPIMHTRDSLSKISKIPELIDNVIPSQIYGKRQYDFQGGLDEDLMDTFGTLKHKKIPLEVTAIDKVLVKDPPSELKPSLKMRYKIKFKDADSRTHSIQIDLPYLREDGSFLINGQNRVIINQLITDPIFFPKPFTSLLTTAYTSMNVHSKQLKAGSYLMCYVGGYKMPLVLLLFYVLGVEDTFKLFGIKYKEITQEESKNNDNSLKFPNGKFYEFTTNSESGSQLIKGLQYCVKSFPTVGDIDSKSYWRKSIVDFLGTRNCIYIIDENWLNILTSTEKEVLKSKGDPTNMRDIIKYMADGVVNGRVDDRNSLDGQRVRTAELFTSLIYKQLNSAYNEYLAKKLGGDDNARLVFNSTKAFSEIVNSQNVQILETINPVEELSMMTRVTSIGFGGIPDKRAVSIKSMNLHPTYYGNIDPLETPDGGNVGILQHLSMGSNIINKRGMFGQRNSDIIEGQEILSVSPSLVPFGNTSDGCRVLMASGQIKQAVPLLNPEQPAVQTGYESALVDLLSDRFVKKSELNGTVTEVVPFKKIIIEDEYGSKDIVDIQPTLLRSGQGKHGTCVFQSAVSVGDKIKKGTVIAEGGGVKNGTISLGVNLLTAFTTWFGNSFEDSIVVSESAAKKFTSLHTLEEELYIQEDDDVVFISPEGKDVEKGEIIVTYSPTSYDVETHRHLRAPGAGKIINIEVYSNLDKIPKKLEPAFLEFRKQYIEKNGKYPQGAFREKGEKIEGIKIKVTILQQLQLVKGDKLNNRHFNKGVISIIEKDENMPITPWGERVELILNPISVINRMNNSQVYEVHCGLISRELSKKMNSMSRADFTGLLNIVLPLLDGSKNKKLSTSIISKTKSLSDNMYNKMKSEIVKSKFFTLYFAPFQVPTYKDILKVMKILGIEPRVYLDIPGYGKSDGKVTVGYLTETKLEHLSEKKLSSRSIGGYSGKTLAPIKKKGSSAQKVSEGDLMSLLAWDCPVLIEEFFGGLSTAHEIKNEMLGDIVQSGTTHFKEPRTNTVKDMYSQMMWAIHLESN